MILVIHRTLKKAVIATVQTELTTPFTYMQYLRKFNVEISYEDAMRDIAEDVQVDLTLPIESDYRLEV